MIRVAMKSKLSYQRNDGVTYLTCSSVKSVIEVFLDEVVMVRNAVKKLTVFMFGRYLWKTKRV